MYLHQQQWGKEHELVTAQPPPLCLQHRCLAAHRNQNFMSWVWQNSPTASYGLGLLSLETAVTCIRRWPFSYCATVLKSWTSKYLAILANTQILANWIQKIIYDLIIHKVSSLYKEGTFTSFCIQPSSGSTDSAEHDRKKGLSQLFGWHPRREINEFYIYLAFFQLKFYWL